MKKKFTMLFAALALLTTVFLPTRMTGQTTVSTTMSDYVTAHECTISVGSNATCYTELTLDDNITMSTSGQANCGSFWGTSPNIEWRLYQNKNGDVSISAAEGYSLSSVTFTFTNTNNGVLLDGTTPLTSGTTYNVSGSSVTYTVGNSGSATNGQIRIRSVEVVYTGGSSTTPYIIASNQNIAYDATQGAIPYSIGNPVGSTTLNANTTADWVSNVTVGNDEVTFNTTQNTEGTARTATFTLTYGATDKTVTVTQAAAPVIYTTIPDLFAAATSSNVDVTITFDNWVKQQCLSY